MQRGKRRTSRAAILAAALAFFAVAVLVGSALQTNRPDSASFPGQQIEPAGLALALSPAGSEVQLRVSIPRHDGRAWALGVASLPIEAPETAFAPLHWADLHQASTAPVSVAPCRSPPLLSFS